jgi:hypothetical protein
MFNTFPATALHVWLQYLKRLSHEIDLKNFDKYLRTWPN